MQGFIKRFSDFSTAKTFRAVEWDIALRSTEDEVSTVVVVAGDVDAGDVGDWLIMAGALLRIESVQTGTSTTTVKCRDLASAFARTFLLQDLMEDETISYFIMDTLGQQFEAADDAAYALPYLTASATTEGDIAYHAPETDDYGRFEFDEYLRMVARVYNIHLSWSITGADELSITVGRGTMRGGQIVLGAGADQLAETPIFASAEVAKITVLQKNTAEDGTETVSKLDRYLYTDGTFGASATGGTRAEGGWEYLTVSPNATADEIEDKVAQRFERGMSDSKISFFSARDLDVGAPVVLRVSGRKHSGHITYKGIKSSDKRYFYRCGNRPVTLTEKLRTAEKTATAAALLTTGTEESLDTALPVKAAAAFDINACYDAGVYLVSKGTNVPSGSSYGVLLVLPYRKAAGNAKPDFAAQIYLPNGDDDSAPNSMFFRTSTGSSWNSWQEI